MRKSKFSSEKSSNDSYVTPKLERIFLVNVAFVDALKYETYRLHDKSPSYDGKKAARTAKLAQRMETITKPYKFDDADPVTVLSFLGKFKRACDSNGVSEWVAM